MIILVDDDPINNFIFSNMTKLGQSQAFQSFTSPNDALVFFKDNIDKIKLIILDINMPGIDGFDFLEEIEKIQSSVRVIFITSSVIKSHEQEARSHSIVDDYYIKPLKAEDKQKLGKYLEKIILN